MSDLHGESIKLINFPDVLMLLNNMLALKKHKATGVRYSGALLISYRIT